MRVAACLLSAALLSACGAEPGIPPLPTDQVRARFPPGGVVNSIEIDAIDRLPLRTAELVAPDGEATPASYLHVDPSPSVTFYQRRIDTPYEGNLFGIGSTASAPVPARGQRRPARRCPTSGDGLDRLDPGARRNRISPGLAQLPHLSQFRRSRRRSRKARPARSRAAAERLATACRKRPASQTLSSLAPPGVPIIDSTSRRLSGSSRNAPSMRLVTIVTPGLCTPRVVMH